MGNKEILVTEKFGESQVGGKLHKLRRLQSKITEPVPGTAAFYFPAQPDHQDIGCNKQTIEEISKSRVKIGIYQKDAEGNYGCSSYPDELFAIFLRGVKNILMVFIVNRSVNIQPTHQHKQHV